MVVLTEPNACGSTFGQQPTSWWTAVVNTVSHLQVHPVKKTELAPDWSVLREFCRNRKRFVISSNDDLVLIYRLTWSCGFCEARSNGWFWSEGQRRWEYQRTRRRRWSWDTAIERMMVKTWSNPFSTAAPGFGTQLSVCLYADDTLLYVPVSPPVCPPLKTPVVHSDHQDSESRPDLSCRLARAWNKFFFLTADPEAVSQTHHQISEMFSVFRTGRNSFLYSTEALSRTLIWSKLVLS